MLGLLKKRSFEKPAWSLSTALLVLSLTILIPVSIWLIIFGLVKSNILPLHIARIMTGDNVLISLVRIIISFAIELSLLYWVKHRYSLKLADFGLKKFNIIRALLTILAMFMVFIALVFIAYLLITVLLPNVNLDEAQKSGFELGRHGVGLIGSFIVTVIFAPLIEEVYFRGFILPSFSSRWGDLVGIVITSAIFGVLHMQVNVGIYTFIFGVILSVMYIRLKSIGPGILLHMLNNALAFYILLKL